MGHDSSDVGWVSLSSALGCMGWWSACARVWAWVSACAEGWEGVGARIARARWTKGVFAWLRRPEAMGADWVGCVWIHAGGRGGNLLWRA